MLKPVGKPVPPPPPAAPKVQKAPHELIGEIADLISKSFAALGLPPSAYTQEHQTKLVWLAGSAAVFSTWVQGDLWTWTAPAGYSTRLTRAAAWAQEKRREAEGREDGTGNSLLLLIRDQVLEVLDSTWPAMFEICSKPDAEPDGTMLFARLPTLWVPDEEFGPVVSGPVPVLPVWEDSPCGRTAEQWDVYAGLLAFLNMRLGFDILDMSPSDLPF